MQRKTARTGQHRQLFALFPVMIAMLFAAPAFAFNDDECAELFPSQNGDHPPYFAIFYSSTSIPSTSSYISSTGECSMYSAQADQFKKLQMLANSQEALKNEISQAGGEHVRALAKLYNCSGKARDHFALVLTNNFNQLFPTSTPQRAGALSGKIGGLLRDDFYLSLHCRSAG